MPVLSQGINSEKPNKLSKNFIRIQNLPWTACASDIKKFFRGLDIKEGGIIVRNFEAYVTFENPSDVRLALYRRNIVLHGCKLELSAVSEVELRKLLCSIARRKLDFDSMEKEDNDKSNVETPPRRKIRPTALVKGDKQRSASCSTFLPKEIDDVPFSCINGDCRFTELISHVKRSASGTKRLNPTNVSRIEKNLANFHPEECFQVKKIKLEE